MIIPRGVKNILGVPTDNEFVNIVNVLGCTELDDRLTLKEAVILDPTGNAGSIYRIFESELGERVGIINADYGLLEKKDQLGYGEIEIGPFDDDDLPTKIVKYVLVYDFDGNLQGFITGSQKF